MTEGMTAPFPYFGGKRRAASFIWEALGSVDNYIEPFCGSCAVLLARPGWRPGVKWCETVNDVDGYLVNAWRSIQLDPDATAAHCADPISEIDYHARLAWLQERRSDEFVTWLEGNPEHYDAKLAGWWLYVLSAGIGDPFGPGPWCVLDEHLVDSRELPHLGDKGRGVNRALPHLGNKGRGIAMYFAQLQARLEHVRICAGDWRRVLTPVVLRVGGATGVLLDPPYSTGGDLYACGCATGTLSAACREWAVSAPADLRVVLCGYDAEHDELLNNGWTYREGRPGGGGGYSHAAHKREGLWLSPACKTDQERLAV